MRYGTIIGLFHVFIVAPLFITIGIFQTKTPTWLFRTLLVIAILMSIYHIYRYIENKTVINIFHLVVIVPLLAYISLLGKKTPQVAFLLLFVYGIVALWYHGKYLVEK